VHNGIDRSYRDSQRIRVVNESQRRLLMRDRDICAKKFRLSQCRDASGKCIRRYVPGLVRCRDDEMVERGLLEDGRDRVLERVTENATLVHNQSSLGLVKE
jgi:hypothetical protein